MYGATGKPKIQEELDGGIRIWAYEEWVEELKRRRVEAAKEIDDAEKEVAEQISLPDQVEDELPDNSTKDNG